MASQEYLDLLDAVQQRVPELIEDLRQLHIDKNAGYAGADNWPDVIQYIARKFGGNL